MRTLRLILAASKAVTKSPLPQEAGVVLWERFPDRDFEAVRVR